MSNKDIAEVIDVSASIIIALSGFIWLSLSYKLGKIYDELQDIKKEKKKLKHGYWIEEEYSKDDCGINDFKHLTFNFICSECYKKVSIQHFDKNWDYCPYCGAYMKGDK